MYEEITYEDLLQQKLDMIADDVDKREGSIVFNALAGNSVEAQLLYIALDSILNETFADTATREFLIKRAAERGMSPEPATHARLKGLFNINIPIGSRFSLEDQNYETIEKIADGEFILEAETVGNEGNLYLGTLIPIEYIDGLTSAELVEVLIPGDDEEDTESFRRRYFSSFNSQAFGGNRQDYKDKVNSLQGVGGVKVYRAWEGGGTVKLVVLNSLFQKPSQVLIDSLQETIDPLGSRGEGVGLAPMDHIVTVEGVFEDSINIETTIIYQDGWSWVDIEPYVIAAIDEYFESLNETWADQEALVVRISQIETRLLGLPGIIDIANTKLNGLQQNVVLDPDAIAVRGDISG
ncbi:baseplate J/gp47 family protein [Cytobacillus gottheilii]|uniref:Baseplate J/gp47 family protein n=1 Tax=Cytobacillus gottheilii TaxID=859144 RepID=A0ABX8FAS1_9BACI|nr:baseplate J/gp47 family protein [Cytobacillus gottheilii]QVY60923.1 baseplate J/gp47 family protein [Cytobacillus gottheilii]